MKLGTPIDLDKCRNRISRSHACGCGPKCRACGFGKHMAIHGGVMGKPGYVFGHEFQPPINATSTHGETP